MGISITEAPPPGAPYQLFDALPDHIEDALRASIERFGVLVPVVRDQHGTTIDGHHRARIADALGTNYRVDTITVADEDEAREIARHLNSRRRHLSGEQLREHIVMLAQRTTAAGVGELSQREIAQVAGVSHQYVGQVLAEPELASTSQLPELRRGADGKVRPAHRESATPTAPAAPGPALFSDEWVEPDDSPADLLAMTELETVAPTAFIRPAPPVDTKRQAENATISDIIAADPGVQAAAALIRFNAACGNVRNLTTFDAERMAEILDAERDAADRWTQLERLRATVEDWFDRMESARQKPGLRLAGGAR